METTLDVQGLRRERGEYLKDLIERWKKQDSQLQEGAGSLACGNDLDKDIVFATHKSHIIGGIRRATAYEHD
ncbi:MAG: hypothetical protein HYW07_24480 [Candidatus Latescibacteria bacterium]|nr:hypothetical protein [Candidatus Latescibacterota bacterium]